MRNVLLFSSTNQKSTANRIMYRDFTGIKGEILGDTLLGKKVNDLSLNSQNFHSTFYILMFQIPNISILIFQNCIIEKYIEKLSFK